MSLVIKFSFDRSQSLFSSRAEAVHQKTEYEIPGFPVLTDFRNHNFGEGFLLHQGQQGSLDDILRILCTPVNGLIFSFVTQSRHLFLYNSTNVFRKRPVSRM